MGLFLLLCTLMGGCVGAIGMTAAYFLWTDPRLAYALETAIRVYQADEWLVLARPMPQSRQEAPVGRLAVPTPQHPQLRVATPPPAPRRLGHHNPRQPTLRGDRDPVAVMPLPAPHKRTPTVAQPSTQRRSEGGQRRGRPDAVWMGGTERARRAQAGLI